MIDYCTLTVTCKSCSLILIAIYIERNMDAYYYFLTNTTSSS